MTDRIKNIQIHDQPMHKWVLNGQDKGHATCSESFTHCSIRKRFLKCKGFFDSKKVK